MVYDGCYTADEFAVLICKIKFGLTEFEGRVFCFIESIKVVHHDAWNIIGIAFIHPVGEPCKYLEISFSGYCLD